MIGSNFVTSNITSYDGLKSAAYHVGLTPRAGYFVKDNLMVGVNLYTSISGYAKSRYATIGAGVFGRYYFGKGLEKSGEINRLRFFVEGGADYGFGFGSGLDNDGTRVKYTQRDMAVHVMPGLNYFFTKNIALETGLSFSRSRDNYRHTNFGSIDQMSFNVGLQIFFRK